MSFTDKLRKAQRELRTASQAMRAKLVEMLREGRVEEGISLLERLGAVDDLVDPVERARALAEATIKTGISVPEIVRKVVEAADDGERCNCPVCVGERGEYPAFVEIGTITVQGPTGEHEIDMSDHNQEVASEMELLGLVTMVNDVSIDRAKEQDSAKNNDFFRKAFGDSLN